jgi:hypothetical protein
MPDTGKSPLVKTEKPPVKRAVCQTCKHPQSFHVEHWFWGGKCKSKLGGKMCECKGFHA